MKRLSLLCAVAVFVLMSETSFAQLSQLGGGTGTTSGRTTGGGTTGTGGVSAAAGGGGAGATNPNGAAGSGGGGQAGATTQGLSGTTTQGIGASGAGGQGVAGANATSSFIGGNSTQGFVGGNVQTQQNANRQFRALQNTNVPTGNAQQATGTPRRVPTSLRIGFAFPQPDSMTRLVETGLPPVQRVSVIRPEFQGVDVELSAEGIAVLTGRVPDSATKRIAGILVRQQSGVRRVDNRLLVAAPQ
ncbi:MAG: BON domain-containing protein [Planctomycetaceae bacterium]